MEESNTADGLRNGTTIRITDEEEIESRIKSLESELNKRKHELALLRKRKDKVSDNDESGSSKASFPPLTPLCHKGYLYRWLDRTIGWGGTKWSLRFVSVENGRIAYYGSHRDDDPRYVLALRGCVVRDEGYKENKRFKPPKNQLNKNIQNKPGACFHVFCIHQEVVSTSEEKEDTVICPLLRFSTTSLAEKNQWMAIISEGCAYADTDAFLEDERARYEEEERQRKQRILMADAMPQARKGTLPPLYFATSAILPNASGTPLKKLPSGSGLNVLKRQQRKAKGQNYRRKSKIIDAEHVDVEPGGGGYPPSKPMHRQAEPSYLSEEATVQNYRGLFNLMVIILALSHTRLILDTIQPIPGLLFSSPYSWKEKLSSFAISENKFHDYPIVTGFLAMQVFLCLSYIIERLLSQKKLPNWLGMILHHLNAHLCLALSCYTVYQYVEEPFSGAIVLFHVIILWMKLISYALVNEDYRTCVDYDAIITTTLEALVKDLDPIVQSYPENVTLSNLYYFWLAPTLTYQIAFPRSDQVRIWKVLTYLFRFVLVLSLMFFLTAQVVTPTLRDLIQDLDDLANTPPSWDVLVEYAVRLAIANTYCWLLMFYGYFHVFLNITAELLRFGDRVFYKDWWNSSDVSTYWRLWNTPVHYWLVRHWYFPLIRTMRVSKAVATLLVFFLSAVMHEILISLPFHMIRPWAYLGMMGQLPLVWITKYMTKHLFPGKPSMGNIIFWLSFCIVGQPMAILLYTIDYQFMKETDGSGHLLSTIYNAWKVKLNSSSDEL